MDLNYQQLHLRLFHLSLLVEQNSLLNLLSKLFSTLQQSEMLLLLINCLILVCASAFHK